MNEEGDVNVVGAIPFSSDYSWGAGAIDVIAFNYYTLVADSDGVVFIATITYDATVANYEKIKDLDINIKTLVFYDD